ncbi:MAG: hypothetical protein JST80_02935 [Bdellovibrionales bacterium]|nr:hypothetical protein [Bdellovibrionales bacterium]
MTREEKMELIQRMLGIKHKLKVHDSMQAPETHEEQSVSLLSRWELEDELKAIEILIDDERVSNIKAKQKQIEETYLSGKPLKKKK